MQGHFFSPPLTAEDLTQLLQNNAESLENKVSRFAMDVCTVATI